MKKKCALCREDRILRDSHLIPKWAYRRLQNPESGGGPPIRVSNGSVVQTNAQVKQYLLCEECEQRFSQREDYVAKITALKNGSLEILQYVTRSPSLKTGEFAASFEIDEVAYFAISVFWRAHVMDEKFELGPYAEHFRKYLMGNPSLPDAVLLTIGVLEASEPTERPQNWITFPSSGRWEKIRAHGFMICGLVFRCFIGQDISTEIKKLCIARANTRKFVMFLDATDFDDMTNAKSVALAAMPRGKLAKRYR